MSDYINTLFNKTPASVLIVLVCAVVVYSLFNLGVRGLKDGFKQTLLGLLFTYAIFIVCITVVYRPVVGYEIRLIPFGSYFILYDGCERAFEENLMNILAFIPIGFLLTVGSKRPNWIRVVAIGLFFSFVIEFMQFYFKRGHAEIDDLIHNTSGCVIGYFIAKCVLFIYNRVDSHSSRY